MLTKSRIKTFIGCTALAALSAGYSSQIYAQRGTTYADEHRIHPYIGAGYGLYKSGSGDYDEDRDLWEVYGGLAFHRYFAVEASWVNLGSMDNEFVDVDMDGWGLALVGQVPFNEAFSVYGKLGQLFWDAEVDTDDLSRSFDGDEPFFTVGAGLVVADPLTITLEYTRYNAELRLNEIAENSDSDDLDTVKAGLRFAF